MISSRHDRGHAHFTAHYPDAGGNGTALDSRSSADRSAGRAKVRKRNTRKPQSSAKVPAACHDCGTILEDSARRYCDDCLPDIREERLSTFTVAGPAALARRRAAGTDPAHGGDAGKSRGLRNAKHHHAIADWEREDVEKLEPEYFTRNILPMLQGIPLSKMASTTGLTEGYCSFVRRGLKGPHRRHWSALADLGNKNSG